MTDDVGVLYGDTDSTFLSGIDPFNEPMMEFVGEWLTKDLDNFCSKYNATNNFKLRPDKSFASFIQVVIPGEDRGKKKNYAGFVVKELKEKVGGSEWKNTFDFETTGFEKSDISKAGMDVFLDILKRVCIHRVRTKWPKLIQAHPEIQGGVDIESELMTYIKTIKARYMGGKYPLYDISTTIRATKPLSQYGKTSEVTRGDKTFVAKKSVPAHIRAAIWSNENLNTSFDSGDKIPWIYVVNNRGTDVIAVDENWDYEYLKSNNLRVDYQTMWNKEVVGKIEPIVLTIGLNLTEILTGMKKQTMDRWFK